MNRNTKLRAALASGAHRDAAARRARTDQAASTTMANDLPPVDKAFVQAASSAGSTEIDAAKLATKQSQDKDVKSFAHHMMVDHTKLAMQLKMAAPHGVTVPMDNSDTSALDSLKALHGKEFDTAYIQKVGVQGHQEAVQVFQKEATGRPERQAQAGRAKGAADHPAAFEDGAGSRREEGRAVVVR